MYEEFLLKLWSRKNTPLFIFLARLSLFPSQLLQKFPLFLNFNIPSPLYCYFSSLSPYPLQCTTLSIIRNIYEFTMDILYAATAAEAKRKIESLRMHFLPVLCRHFNGFVFASSNHSLTNFITQCRQERLLLAILFFRCRTQKSLKAVEFLHVR